MAETTTRQETGSSEMEGKTRQEAIERFNDLTSVPQLNLVEVAVPKNTTLTMGMPVVPCKPEERHNPEDTCRCEHQPDDEHYFPSKDFFMLIEGFEKMEDKAAGEMLQAKAWKQLLATNKFQMVIGSFGTEKCAQKFNQNITLAFVSLLLAPVECLSLIKNIDVKVVLQIDKSDPEAEMKLCNAPETGLLEFCLYGNEDQVLLLDSITVKPWPVYYSNTYLRPPPRGQGPQVEMHENFSFETPTHGMFRNIPFPSVPDLGPNGQPLLRERAERTQDMLDTLLDEHRLKKFIFEAFPFKTKRKEEPDGIEPWTMCVQALRQFIAENDYATEVELLENTSDTAHAADPLEETTAED